MSDEQPMTPIQRVIVAAVRLGVWAIIIGGTVWLIKHGPLLPWPVKP
jgi:hypothetical protein